MKAITVCNPWAEMIARGLKLVENRSWPTSYRGPLAIHAGKSLAWLNRENPLQWPDLYGVDLPQAGDLTFGAFVAVCELTDCVRIEDLAKDLQSPWAGGPFCWVLKNVRRIEPVRCQGMQGLWTPPAQIMPKLAASSSLEGPTYSKLADMR